MNNNQSILSRIYNSTQAKVYGALIAASLGGCVSASGRLDEQLETPVATETRYSLDDMRSFAQEYLRLEDKTDRNTEDNVRMDNLLNRMKHGLQTSEGRVYLLINYERTPGTDPVSYIVRSAITLEDIATAKSAAVTAALPSDRRLAELVAHAQNSFNYFLEARHPQDWDSIGYLLLADEGQVNAVANHNGALAASLRLVNENGEQTSAEVTEQHYAILTDGDKTNGEIHAERPGALLLVIEGQQPVEEQAAPRATTEVPAPAPATEAPPAEAPEKQQNTGSGNE